MAENHKQRFLTCTEMDRISNLPQHLIALILDRLPVQDAVRTSILSKNWRYAWTTMTLLVFDCQLSENIVKVGAFGHNGFIRIINDVLILHNGPISKFSLHIPRIDLDSFRQLDQTMLLISRKSVEELALTNFNRCYDFPSYVSSCSKLRKLELTNFIFNPPLKFEVFSDLEDLILKNIDFGDNSCGALITLPQLRRLVLVTCQNVYNFNIKAPQLQVLVVFGCREAMLPQLLDSPHLHEVCLCFLNPVKDFERVARMNLTRLLSNLPKIKKLTMDGPFFKYLSSADEIPKWLPRAVNGLSHLQLKVFQVSDLDQLHGALCLLRNSPNLERLYMRQSPREQPWVNVDAASDHLEQSFDCLDLTLNRLQTVEIESFDLSRPAYLFIEVLLAYSPSLVKLTIEPIRVSYARQSLMTTMRFYRASPKAELIFVDPKS